MYAVQVPANIAAGTACDITPTYEEDVDINAAGNKKHRRSLTTAMSQVAQRHMRT